MLRCCSKKNSDIEELREVEMSNTAGVHEFQPKSATHQAQNPGPTLVDSSNEADSTQEHTVVEFIAATSSTPSVPEIVGIVSSSTDEIVYTDLEVSAEEPSSENSSVTIQKINGTPTEYGLVVNKVDVHSCVGSSLIDTVGHSGLTLDNSVLSAIDRGDAVFRLMGDVTAECLPAEERAPSKPSVSPLLYDRALPVLAEEVSTSGAHGNTTDEIIRNTAVDVVQTEHAVISCPSEILSCDGNKSDSSPSRITFATLIGDLGSGLDIFPSKEMLTSQTAESDQLMDSREVTSATAETVEATHLQITIEAEGAFSDGLYIEPANPLLRAQAPVCPSAPAGAGGEAHEHVIGLEASNHVSGTLHAPADNGLYLGSGNHERFVVGEVAAAHVLPPPSPTISDVDSRDTFPPGEASEITRQLIAIEALRRRLDFLSPSEMGETEIARLISQSSMLCSERSPEARSSTSGVVESLAEDLALASAAAAEAALQSENDNARHETSGPRTSITGLNLRDRILRGSLPGRSPAKIDVHTQDAPSNQPAAQPAQQAIRPPHASITGLNIRKNILAALSGATSRPS